MTWHQYMGAAVRIALEAIIAWAFLAVLLSALVAAGAA
jgi:hypothetical protein